jgi:hypothetical protein
MLYGYVPVVFWRVEPHVCGEFNTEASSDADESSKVLEKQILCFWRGR